MRPLRNSVRLLYVLFAILQMATPALASIADARLLARNDRLASQSHIEDHTRRSCAAVHTDDCALCQLLSGLAPEPQLPAELPTAAREGCVAGEQVQLAVDAAGRRLTRSRAPPIA